MKFGKLTRRRFILGSLALAPALICVDARWIEPEWVKTRTIRLADGAPRCRLVHFTDVHHKGDRAYLESVARKINALSPDAVCFTGDIIEQAQYLPEALSIFETIKSPLYGVPGNHDYWSGVNFREIAVSFAKTGGAWLEDQQRVILGGKYCLTGATCESGMPLGAPTIKGARNILLAHYPQMADRLRGRKYDLILAGHSHGGQARLPFIGAPIIPYWCGKYECGLYQTPGGPLYVNPGIGYLVVPIRFNCRPEITVFEI